MVSPACPLLLVALVALVAQAQGQAQATTSCPEPALPWSSVNKFDPEQYLGLWYEIQRVPRSFEKFTQCGTAHYSWTDNTNATVSVTNKAFAFQLGMTYTVNLLATPTAIDEGKLSVTYPSMPRGESMYWVLGSDYKNYAVVYSCDEPSATDVLPTITLWVLSRQQTGFNAMIKDEVQKILNGTNLPLDALEDVQQRDCREPSCKACPGAKPNLDLSKLKGRWWEVNHSPFATGASQSSCSLYELSATDEGIRVDSYTATTVSDNVTDTSASVTAKWKNGTSKNGEFKLTSKGADSNDNFCVIDTDYDNWAVLSMCGAPAQSSTTAPPAPGFTPASRGGVWLVARKHGLSAEHQMEANKALLTAGLPASVMVSTPSTPCPAKAFTDYNSGTLLAATPVVLLASLLVAATRQLGH